MTQITVAIIKSHQVGRIMGCFEDLMEFRDKVADAEMKRKGRARLPGPEEDAGKERKEK